MNDCQVLGISIWTANGGYQGDYGIANGEVEIVSLTVDRKKLFRLIESTLHA